MIYAGIDVAKATLQVCVLGASQQQREFGNTPKRHQQLVKWFKQQKDKIAVVGLEATGSYGEAVCAYLYEQGMPIAN